MRRLPLLAIAFTLLAGCAARAPAPAATADDLPGVLVVASTPERASQFTTAILEDARYQHPRLDVDVEMTLVWWNADDEVHSVVSDDGAFAGSGPIAPGGEFVHTFLTPGDYRYHCRYHDGMRGIVVAR